MGRLEKIVVCTVLFLVAAILGISLSTDPAEGPQASGGKSAQADADLKAERRLARERAQAALNEGGAPGGVMSTSLAPRGAAAPRGASESTTPTPSQAPNQVPATTPDPAGGQAPTSASGANNTPPAAAPAVGAGAPVVTAAQPQTEFLVSRAGLAPTASDEFMSYTWQSGDSFRALAQRFYGSPLHVKRLRDANEGRDEAKLAPGDTILVTVKPTAQADRLARPSARDAKAGQGNAGSVVGGTYTVGSGDVLGAISQKVYGTATKWRTIYDANRDVIGADPNQLKPGMVLRIPQ